MTDRAQWPWDVTTAQELAREAGVSVATLFRALRDPASVRDESRQRVASALALLPRTAAPAAHSLATIAERAQVSVSTASRALAGDARVTPATRLRVAAIASELDYVPDRRARSLAQPGPGPLVLVTPSIAGHAFARTARQIEDVATAAGHPLEVLSTGSFHGDADALVHRLRAHRARAAVVLGGPTPDALPSVPGPGPWDALVSAGIRVVLCGRPALPDAALADVVDCDHAAGSAAAVDHLVGLGHRRLAYVGAVPGNAVAQERARGARAAAAAAGVHLDVLDASDLSADGGRADGVRLARRPEVTGVLAANDAVAIGCMSALQHAGREIPRDVSVVGFDDIEHAAYTSPRLTTIRVPAIELAQAAATLALTPDRAPAPVLRTLPASLVIRESTGPAPSASRR